VTHQSWSLDKSVGKRKDAFSSHGVFVNSLMHFFNEFGERSTTKQ